MGEATHIRIARSANAWSVCVMAELVQQVQDGETTYSTYVRTYLCISVYCYLHDIAAVRRLPEMGLNVFEYLIIMNLALVSLTFRS